MSETLSRVNQVARGSVDAGALDESGFPFSAFSKDNPDKTATPVLALNAPWTLDADDGYECVTDTNGTYRKFRYGLMIFWWLGEITSSTSIDNVFGTTAGTVYYGDKTFTFSVPFIDVPAVSACSAALSIYATVHNVSTTGGTFRVYSSASAVNYSRLIAIGKWK